MKQIMQAPCFGRTSRLLVPIYGNSADEQNGPPMNADKRRWNEKLCLSAFIRVHPRSSAAKYRPSEFSSRTANRWSTPRAQFPERDVSSSLWITPQPMFEAHQRMIRFWLCESTASPNNRLVPGPLFGNRQPPPAAPASPSVFSVCVSPCLCASVVNHIVAAFSQVLR